MKKIYKKIKNLKLGENIVLKNGNKIMKVDKGYIYNNKKTGQNIFIEDRIIDKIIFNNKIIKSFKYF